MRSEKVFQQQLDIPISASKHDSRQPFRRHSSSFDRTHGRKRPREPSLDRTESMLFILFFLLLIPPFVHFSHIYFHLPLNHQVLWLSTVFGLSIDAPKLSMDMASPCPSLSAFNTPSHSPLMRQPSISEASTPFHLNSSAAVRCSSKPLSMFV